MTQLIDLFRARRDNRCQRCRTWADDIRRSAAGTRGLRAGSKLRLVFDVPLSPSPRSTTTRLQEYLDRVGVPTPCLVMDLDAVRAGYTRVSTALPEARIRYAVKANPAPEILRLLAGVGSGFDVASPGEIERCLDAGADPALISYGNTIKKAADIRFASDHGVREFTVDSASDLADLARIAPGARVFCRVLVPTTTTGAATPFGRKFGCNPETAARLLVRAAQDGLDPVGVAFHVGSQHVDPSAWDTAIAAAAAVTDAVADDGVALRGLNLGGGFPAGYRTPVPPLADYVAVIRDSVRRHFGGRQPELTVEPGRAIVADAGLIRTEVVRVARKSEKDTHRWVYLDIGRYGGLAETENEAITYRITTAQDGTPDGPVIIAGPSCDGDDVLYQHTPYRLPLSIREGDQVDILSAGAYTASYASVGFNGFPPLRTCFVGGTDPTPGGFGAFTGRHVLAEFAGIDPVLLDDPAFLCDALEQALRQAEASVCEVSYKRFVPQGVTVLAMLAESHASVHTYPERGAVFVDVFTCGDRADPERAVRLLRESLGATTWHTETVHRGLRHRGN
jgi:ornithine decarboxylase